MSASAPSATSGWELHVTSPNDGSDALVWNDNLELSWLDPADIVVKLHEWALDYLDLAIANGTFPWEQADQGVIIPGSDGAGEVVVVVQIRDKVIVVYYINFPHGNVSTLKQMQGIRGGNSPGTFRYHGVLDESGLIQMPSNLTYAEATTFPCSALTVWNALHGLTPLKADDYILAQRTGGVSLLAVSVALAAGAMVIATTS